MLIRYPPAGQQSIIKDLYQNVKSQEKKYMHIYKSHGIIKSREKIYAYLQKPWHYYRKNICIFTKTMALLSQEKKYMHIYKSHGIIKKRDNKQCLLDTPPQGNSQ